MAEATRTYVWCNGCERRIDSVLMKANRCAGCRDDARRLMLERLNQNDRRKG